MIFPTRLNLNLQWQRTLHVLMKTWKTVCVHDDFWIFENKNRKIKTIFEWDTKQFHFMRR